ncbi:hypothetical protein B0H19DRAFT_1277221 [Mycena capillaripes]|nr:hypothetical protein B0H19DRAFT_1277221 [Mycena capillaripes]
MTADGDASTPLLDWEPQSAFLTLLSISSKLPECFWSPTIRQQPTLPLLICKWFKPAELAEFDCAPSPIRRISVGVHLSQDHWFTFSENIFLKRPQQHISMIYSAETTPKHFFHTTAIQAQILLSVHIFRTRDLATAQSYAKAIATLALDD